MNPEGTVYNAMGRINRLAYIGGQALSAYDIAVQNGFKGTVEEWLESLKGEKGDTGYSAYEIAKSYGFEGTEEEWLASLKGEKGDKGDKGDTGGSGGSSDAQGLIDRTTGQVYQLYMDNGNLMLEEEFIHEGEEIV